MKRTALFIDGFKAALRGRIAGRTATGTREGNADYRRGRDAGHALRRDIIAAAVEAGSALKADDYIARLLAKIEAGDMRALEV